MESRTNSTHPTRPAGYHPIRKETHDPCAQTLLLTGAPGCQTESATGSRQCYSLQCSLVHGSGRLFPTPLTELDRRARGTRSQESQDKQKTNEFKDKPLQKIREGREEVTVAGVCVFCLFWMSCDLVPLARLSSSARGEGNSPPEPWTRPHCSEQHWRDPVALCWTARGAREQQSLRTWIVSFFFGLDGIQLAEPLGCYVAMHCRYCTETKTLGKHPNRYLFSLAPSDSARLRNCFTVAAGR